MAKRYLLDEFNNKIEVTDEVGNTTVNEVKCCESGTPFKMAFVTQAIYNELEAMGLLKPNTIYEITDDTTLEDLDKLINETKEDHNERLENIECYYLGATSDSPTSTTSTFYNSITKEGFYNFICNGKPYLMFVAASELLLRQAIVDFISFNSKGINNIEVIVREKNSLSSTFTVSTTKYSMLYEHNIRMEANHDNGSDTLFMNLRILNNSNISLDHTSIQAYFPQNEGETIAVTGAMYWKSYQRVVTGIKKVGGYFKILTSAVNSTATSISEEYVDFTYFNTNIVIKDFKRTLY